MSATANPKTSQPDAQQVRQIVDSIVADRWYWFPVRHHSPATAWHLRNAILERRPKLIFIEGPFESNHLIPILQESNTKPPVAIYTSFQDDSDQFNMRGIASPSEDIPARWACWYPFLDYSPELIAIQTGKEIGARIQFMDLPHFARLKRFEPNASNQESVSNSEPTESSDTDKDLDAGTAEDRLIASSNFYRALADAGGFRSWDEGWDSLFEFREFPDHEAFRTELLTFCAAARLTASPSDSDFEENLERERFMLRTIRKQISATKMVPEDVMIVCGGFHTAMNRKDDLSPPDIPEGTVYTTIVPYSTFRVADISGYGAGNRAPQFYARHWDVLLGKNGSPVADYTVHVLQRARKLGEGLSAADAISITQHARMLAAIRNRAQPILDDLHDAIMTCCCKGDPNEQGIRIRQAIDQVDIGNRVGKVPENAPRLPIVCDFYEQIERLGLTEHVHKERLKRVELDRRKPEDFEQASFFHRLKLTNVGFANMTQQPDTEFESGLIFREHWGLKWSPEVDARLIEMNLLGDTIEAAAINQLKKKIASQSGNAGEICETLVEATQMNLPDLVEQIGDVAATAIEEDPRFVSMTSAVGQLMVLDRYALHYQMRRDWINTMKHRAFVRSCFAMQEITSAPDDKHGEISNGLAVLADIVLKSEKDDDDSRLFIQSVENALAKTEIPFIRGVLLGTLVEIRVLPNKAVTDEILGFANSSQNTMSLAGDFVQGVISVSRTAIMTGSDELVKALDQLIRRSEWEVFTILLPKLRAAMELLHARHRQSLATRVAETYGLVKPSRTLEQLDVSADLMTEIVALDYEVANIMAKWSFVK